MAPSIKTEGNRQEKESRRQKSEGGAEGGKERIISHQ